MTPRLPAGLTAAGVVFDVLRMPAVLGLLLHRRLAADPCEAPRLGPVAYSARSGVTYWLIPTGSSPAEWPGSCALLRQGSYVAFPGDGLTTRSARWLPQPGTAPLSGATWLAAALTTHTTEALR